MLEPEVSDKGSQLRFAFYARSLAVPARPYLNDKRVTEGAQAVQRQWLRRLHTPRHTTAVCRSAGSEQTRPYGPTPNFAAS